MAGRRIDDHKFWAGGHGKGTVFPDGAKMKEERSADGAGSLNMDYPDTTEHIYRDQKKGESEVHKHKMKPGYRY
jgi:hypothetical protein